MSSDKAAAPYWKRALFSVNWLGTGFLVLLGLIWEVSVRVGWLDYDQLPAPWETIRAGVRLWTDGPLAGEFLHTTIAAVCGWAIGSILGVVGGLLLGLYQPIWRWSMGTWEVMRALPAIALVPAVVLVLGFSIRSELAITAYVAIWPVLVNAAQGAREVSEAHLEVGAMMRLPRLSVIRKIVIPSAAPHIVVGMRLSIALALALALVAEMVGNPQGVGYELVMQQQALQAAGMFACVICTGLLGLLLNTVLVTVVGVVSRGTTALMERETT